MSSLTYRAMQFYKHRKMRYGRALVQLAHLGRRGNRTGYIGWTGYGNLGDEILLSAHQRLFPDLSFIPAEMRDFAGLYRRWRKRSFYDYGFLGGGTLIDNRGFWLRYVRDMLDQGLPMACFGTGVSFGEFKQDGPSAEVPGEWRGLLAQFQFVGVRGPQSQAQLRSLGIEAQVVGDTALALAPETAPAPAANGRVGVCFGISHESPIEGDIGIYYQEMAAFVHALLDAGHEVILLPIWHEDFASNRQLLTLINDKRCKINYRAYKTLGAYAKEVSACQFFFGQKLHSTIIATMYRVPSVMIGYRAKCRDYMESVGMQEYLLGTATFTAAAGMQALQKLQQHEPAIRRALDKQMAHYRAVQTKAAGEVMLKLRGPAATR